MAAVIPGSPRLMLGPPSRPSQKSWAVKTKQLIEGDENQSRESIRANSLEMKRFQIQERKRREENGVGLLDSHLETGTPIQSKAFQTCSNLLHILHDRLI